MQISYCVLSEQPIAHHAAVHDCYIGGLSVVQLFGRLDVVETHTLWYFGHHCCLVVGFDVLGIWHFCIFTLFHPFLPFCTLFLLVFTTSTLFLRPFLPTIGTPRRQG